MPYPGLLLSIVHAQAFPDGDAVADAPRLVDEFGFESIETVAVPDRPTPFRPGGAQVVLLGGLPMLRAGVSLSGTGADRRDAVELATRLVDDAAHCEADRLLVTSGPDVEPAARPRALAALADSLSELADAAAERRPGLVVTLEPTDRTLAHRQLVGPTEDALAVLDTVAARSPDVEVNLDVSHLLQLGEDPVTALALAARRCRHVHLANCVLADPADPLYGERHPPFGHPGSEVGATQLVEVVRALHELGYADPDHPTTLGIEVVPPSGCPPWAVLTRAHADVLAALHDARPTSERKDTA